ATFLKGCQKRTVCIHPSMLMGSNLNNEAETVKNQGIDKKLKGKPKSTTIKLPAFAARVAS
ncbi:MAG: hypothetical protein AAFZ49_13390, partial [Cyanobacteria bacterium J06659_2]